MPRSRTLRRKVIGRLSRSLIWFFERWMKGKSPLQAEAAGTKIGRLFFRLSRKHCNRALSNLKLAFPEKTEQERHELAVRVFEHFGMMAADFMRTTARTDEEVIANMQIEGGEIFDRVVAEGKGMLLVTAHFGNWERIAQFARAKGYRIHAIQRDADDSQVNADIVRLREATGLEMISRGNAARGMISLLRQGQIVALLPDQNCEESFVPFFGLPTGTVLGPATLSLRTGAPLVPVFCAHTGPGMYKMHVFPPVEPVAGVEDKIEALTRGMNEAIERIVRQYPEQWLWFHDRWKSARKRGLI